MTKGGARKMINVASVATDANLGSLYTRPRLYNARIHPSGMWVIGNVDGKDGHRVSVPIQRVEAIRWSEVHDPKGAETT